MTWMIPGQSLPPLSFQPPYGGRAVRSTFGASDPTFPATQARSSWNSSPPWRKRTSASFCSRGSRGECLQEFVHTFARALSRGGFRDSNLFLRFPHQLFCIIGEGTPSANSNYCRWLHCSKMSRTITYCAARWAPLWNGSLPACTKLNSAMTTAGPTLLCPCPPGSCCNFITNRAIRRLDPRDPEAAISHAEARSILGFIEARSPFPILKKT
jgi:hypothetical protein